MSEAGVERRLTTIVAADVVGYSRLMAADEAGTLAELKSNRRELIEPKAAQYHGRTIKLMGDGTLMEFASVVDAVVFAVEVQCAMQARNTEVPEDQRIAYRIGINIGDIIVDGEDIYGDGVNIAARLEGLAEPGGVCISRPVHTQIRGKLDFTFEDLGEKEVKNIPEPVTVYRVVFDDKAAALVTPVVQEVAKRERRWWLVAAAAVAVLVLAIGGALWWQPWAPDVEPASVERMAFALPDKPSIAVLPFDNLSGDPGQDYFADGVTESIITELSRDRELFVIARKSTFTYKGKPVEVRQVAEDLGVRYVMEGSVQREGERVRITAQLVDAITGAHVWAERYERDAESLFDLQDEIVRSIVATLRGFKGKIQQADLERSFRKPTENLTAYDHVLRGIMHMERNTKDDNIRARALFEKATELDPNYAAAYAWLVIPDTLDVSLDRTDDPASSLEKAFAAARKAVSLDPALDWAHFSLGMAYEASGEARHALAAYEKALELNPNNSDVLANLVWVFSNLGRPEEGIAKVREAMRLNPHHPEWYLWGLGTGQFFARAYEDAIASLEQIIHHNLWSRALLTASYVYLGQVDKARAQAEKIREIDPDFSLSTFTSVELFEREEDRVLILEGLRKAGLPERSPLPLPDKPSIAVLPFTNMSDDPEQEYFTDGMTEDLITDLSKISSLFVIARNSSFSYKGKPVKVREVAEDLGVRYVLEGSVRRAGDQVRINAQLIDATTGGHLWAERYDGTLADVFDLQDKVTERIVNALALELTPREAQRVSGPGTDNVGAHDTYLLGLSYYNRRTPEDNAKAKPHFEKAIELDPGYSAAHTALAKVYLQATIGEAAYAEKLGIYWRAGYTRAIKLLDKGMARPNADFHVLLSWLALRMQLHDRAIAQAQQALELSPNDTDALEALAEALIFSGDPEEGIDLIQKAMRQNPTQLARPLYLMGLAEFALGHSDKAVEHLQRARELAPKETDFAGILAPALAELGQIEQAKAAFKVFTEGRGDDYQLARAVVVFPFLQRSVLDRLADGFTASGARRGIAGYIPLYSENRLTGSEIKSLLFGREIKGIDFWVNERNWGQRRTVDGKVEHLGSHIHSGVVKGDTGIGRIKGDMLCEQWPKLATAIEVCVVVFRITNDTARIRWGDYVMVTNTGPHPFRVAE